MKTYTVETNSIDYVSVAFGNGKIYLDDDFTKYYIIRFARDFGESSGMKFNFYKVVGTQETRIMELPKFDKCLIDYDLYLDEYENYLSSALQYVQFAKAQIAKGNIPDAIERYNYVESKIKSAAEFIVKFDVELN